MDSANAAIHKYFVEDLSDIVDVSYFILIKSYPKSKPGSMVLCTLRALIFKTYEYLTYTTNRHCFKACRRLTLIAQRKNKNWPRMKSSIPTRPSMLIKSLQLRLFIIINKNFTFGFSHARIHRIKLSVYSISKNK